jgi:formate/nitrite transporter FocA (FNT family)
MLSFGGLLSTILQGGSPSLTTSNPGIVKILGGFVFPVGLAMYVILVFPPLSHSSQLAS